MKYLIFTSSLCSTLAVLCSVMWHYLDSKADALSTLSEISRDDAKALAEYEAETQRLMTTMGNLRAIGLLMLYLSILALAGAGLLWSIREALL